MRVTMPLTTLFLITFMSSSADSALLAPVDSPSDEASLFFLRPAKHRCSVIINAGSFHNANNVQLGSTTKKNPEVSCFFVDQVKYSP